MSDRLDIKLLEFLEPKTGMPAEIGINQFVLSNFKKPNPLPANETDEALVLLRQLQADELIEFSRGVGFYWIGTIDSEQVIKWWDNINGEEVYKITRKGISYLDQYRISQTARETNESVKLTNKWTLRIIAATLLITMVNVYITFKHDSSDNEKDQLKTFLKAKQFQIDSLQSKLNQQQFLINHLLYLQNNKRKNKEK
jgi:hypothetical protein